MWLRGYSHVAARVIGDTGHGVRNSQPPGLASRVRANRGLTFTHTSPRAFMPIADLLQYYSCSVCLMAPPTSPATAAHPGTDPCSPCAAADAVAAEAVPVSDLLLSFQTLGDCAPPSTGCSATPVAAAAAAGNSRTMESILGSAFECCLPLPDDGGALTGAEAARLVTDALQPSPGDCVVALVSELCLLGDLRSALRAGVFNSSSNSSSCSRPHDTSSAPGVAAAALSRSCSGGGPGPTSAAAIRRAAGGAAAAGGGMAGWTPARAVRAVVATAREAALGVLHLHSCGAAHGNLRPSNIQLMEAHTDRRGFVAKVRAVCISYAHRKRVGMCMCSESTRVYGMCVAKIETKARVCDCDCCACTALRCAQPAGTALRLAQWA